MVAAVILAACGLLYLRVDILTEESTQVSNGGRREFPYEYAGDIPLIPGRPGSAIPALNYPRFITAREAEKWLAQDDTVVAIEINGISKAYPTKILNFHEIVNDEVDGIPIAITYCPLAGSALAFERQLNGKTLVFSVADVLYESTLVMRDESTGSLWYQLRGEAIAGEAKGQKLVAHPVIQCAAGYWITNRPSTLVLSYLTGHTTNYISNYWHNPFRGYSNLYSAAAFPVMYLDESRPPKEIVLGIESEGDSLAIPTTELRHVGARFKLNNRTLVATFNEAAGTPFVWWETLHGKSNATFVTCYWFAWKAANWTTHIWTPEQSSSGNVYAR